MFDTFVHNMGILASAVKRKIDYYDDKVAELESEVDQLRSRLGEDRPGDLEGSHPPSPAHSPQRPPAVGSGGAIGDADEQPADKVEALVDAMVS